jgi:O-antigen ligase
MAMTVPLAIGYSFAVFESSPRPREGGLRRWALWLIRPEGGRFALAAFSVLTMATAVALSRSRSGLASLAIASLVMTVSAWTWAGGRLRFLAGLYLTGLIAGSVAWAGLGTILDRFALSATDLPGRVLAWRDALRILGDFPWTGVGIGAFGPAMLQYQSVNRGAIFYQAHNDYLEVLVEGGVLVATPIAVAAAIFLSRVWRRSREPEPDPRRYWIRMGALGGLAGIAAQSVVEFSLQMPGNAMLFVVIAALAAHRTPPAPTRHGSPRERHAVSRIEV